MRPREAIVAINYRCNARCVMCNIWKLKEDGILTPKDYGRLPRGLSNVGVTGGEPFLRLDLVEIVRTIVESVGKPRIIINTNGYLTTRIVAAFRQFRTMGAPIGVGVSLDGIGEMHDTIRGTRHAYEKVIKTVTALKQEGVRDIRFSFTITPQNVLHLPKVHELSKDLGVEFASSVAQNSNHYFHTSSNENVDGELLRRAYDLVNQRELSSKSFKSWFRAYYNHGVVRFNGSGGRLVPCSAGDDFFFLSPRGDVYPCVILPKVMGNILTTTFDDIWSSTQSRSVRADIAGCDKCWMMCSARTQLQARPAKAVLWVAKAQAKRFLASSTSTLQQN